MDPSSRSLQFEMAEGATGGAPSPARCAACDGALEATYYEIDGAASCRSCHDRRASGVAEGSAPGRLLGALVLGTIAGAVGAGVWYGIRAATGYEVGLVSIAIGLLVGGAVRVGSRGRGGLLYQALAVMLTYTAICSTYVPELISGFAEAAEEQAAATGAEDATGDGTDGRAPWEAAAEGAEVADAAAAEAAPAPEPIAVVPVAARPGEGDLGGMLAALAIGGAALLLLAYTVPFLMLPENLIGLLIIAFGLFEAWKLNRRVTPTIRGPFRLGPRVAAS